MKPQEFIQKIEQGIILPLYYFGGPETWLIEEALRRVEEKSLAPATRDFNRTVFNAEVDSSETILAGLQVFPVHSPRRVVVIRQADFTWKKNPTAYIEYFQEPNPQTCAVFIGEKADLRTKFFQALEEKGAVLSFYPPYEKDLFSWVHSQAQQMGHPISEGAIAVLLDRVGPSLQEVRLELQKLVLGKRPGQRIEEDDVLTLTGDVRSESPFELARAIGHLDLRATFHLLQKNLQQGESPVLLLSLITRQLRILRKAKDLRAQGLSKKEIETRLKILPRRGEDLWKQADKFSPSVLERLWRITLMADHGLKSSRSDKGLLLEEYLWNLHLLHSEKAQDSKRR